jgi:hypothetical protein
VKEIAYEKENAAVSTGMRIRLAKTAYDSQANEIRKIVRSSLYHGVVSHLLVQATVYSSWSPWF